MTEMEVDDVGVVSCNKNALFVCCLSKKGGLKRTRIEIPNFDDLSLNSLKENVIQELNKWEWADPAEKPTNIDVMLCSRVLKTDDDVKRVRPFSVVSVIDKNKLGSNAEADQHKSEKYIADYAKSRNIHEQLRSCSLALKTAFLNPKFVTMVENLGNSEMLENVFAIVPELKYDPVAIGIIQDPSLIFHLSDAESLKKLAATKPWVIEAFNFIAASIHQDKDTPSQGLPPGLFNAGFFDGEDDSMEEGEDEDEGAAGPSPRITREQLASALSALAPGQNAFSGLFRPPTTAPTVTPPQQQPSQSTPNPAVAGAGANIQNLMNTLAGAGGGIPGQPLSSEMVARAVTQALRRLTPEQRADQLNAIRNFASQLQQGDTSSSPSQPSVATPPSSQSQTAPPRQAQQEGSTSLTQQYQSQLRQMRDMGITDERLSILALRVSEGDVSTAIELIFSGWQGEGSDPL